jgi:hypothetical protein
MNNKNNKGPRFDPWGTPEGAPNGADLKPLYVTNCVLSLR